MTFDPLPALPFLTADLPGIAGRIKQSPEDFEVEEIPAYEPCGNGDFLYLWIEKRGMGADYFARQIAQRLGLRPGDVGTAGLKDRHAVTRQMVSVPVDVEDRLDALNGDGITLLRVSKHGNKLRPGHLHGNRFRILLRDVDPAAEQRLEPILAKLRGEGLPNYYGPQRFGRDGETALLGFDLLRRTEKRRAAPFLRRLALSAAQSALFNIYLAHRLRDGFLRRLLPGDVMARWPFGGMFVAEDLAVEQARFDARETVHAGPMFGRKTFPARADAARREAELLADAGLDVAAFAGFGKLLQGTRRHNLVYCDDLQAVFEPEGLRLAFTLPAGSYATMLLREITKIDENKSDDSEELV